MALDCYHRFFPTEFFIDNVKSGCNIYKADVWIQLMSLHPDSALYFMCLQRVFEAWSERYQNVGAATNGAVMIRSTVGSLPDSYATKVVFQSNYIVMFTIESSVSYAGPLFRCSCQLYVSLLSCDGLFIVPGQKLRGKSKCEG